MSNAVRLPAPCPFRHYKNKTQRVVFL